MSTSTTDALAAVLQTVTRRIAEAEMRTAARVVGIETLCRSGADAANAESALFREMDALNVLRLQEWRLRNAIEDAGAVPQEVLAFVNARITEVEQHRHALAGCPEKQIGASPSLGADQLLRDLDEALAALLAAHARLEASRESR